MAFDGAPTVQEDPFEVAQRKFATGQSLTQGDQILLDRVLGNNDGAFNDKDIQKIEDDRNDRAFLDRTGAALSAAATYGIVSVAAPDITSELDLDKKFGDAALGRTPALAPQPAPTLGYGGPTQNLGMGMSMDITMAPRGPMGLG